MNATSKHVLLCLFCLTATSAMGQREAWEKKIEANVKLKNEVDKLRNDSTRYQHKLQELRDAKDHFVQSYDSLHVIYSELSALTQNGGLQSLEAEVSNLSEASKQNSQRIAQKKAEIEELRMKIAEMDIEERSDPFFPIYDAWQKEQSYALNKDYLARPFDEMDKETMTEIVRSVSAFTGYKGFSEYKQRVSIIGKAYFLYEQGDSAINAMYNKKEIFDLREEIYPYISEAKKKRELSAVQFAKLDSMDIKLSRYQDGFKYLREIVITINKSEFIKNPNPQTRAKFESTVGGYLAPEEGSERDKRYKRFFDMAPYLKKLRDDYFEELRAMLQTNDNKCETKTGDLILSVKID